MKEVMLGFLIGLLIILCLIVTAGRASIDPAVKAENAAKDRCIARGMFYREVVTTETVSIVCPRFQETAP